MDVRTVTRPQRNNPIFSELNIEETKNNLPYTFENKFKWLFQNFKKFILFEFVSQVFLATYTNDSDKVYLQYIICHPSTFKFRHQWKKIWPEVKISLFF
jgi:hypothetical protein